MKKIASQFKKEVEITKVTNLADLEDKGPQDKEITEKEKIFEDLKLRLHNSEVKNQDLWWLTPPE